MALPPINPKVLAALKAIQDGKRKPIVVTNPNDPRLKAYQDSASNYQNNSPIEKLLKVANKNDVPFYSKYEKGNIPKQFVKNGMEPLAVFVPDEAKRQIAIKEYQNAKGSESAKRRNEFLKNDVYYPVLDKKGNAIKDATGNEIRRGFVSFKEPEQPVVLAPRTPIIVPAKIPIKIAPTNFTQPLPTTPAPQPVAVVQPQPVPVAQPAARPDSLWGPGQRYSLKEAKVRQMLKAIERLKK